MEISSGTKLYRVETDTILPRTAWFFPDKDLADEYLLIYKHRYLNIPLSELKISEYIIQNKLFLPILDSNFTAQDLDNCIQKIDPEYRSEINFGIINNYLTAEWFLKHNLPGWVAFRGSDINFGSWTQIPDYFEIMLTNPENKIKFIKTVEPFS